MDMSFLTSSWPLNKKIGEKWIKKRKIGKKKERKTPINVFFSVQEITWPWCDLLCLVFLGLNWISHTSQKKKIVKYKWILQKLQTALVHKRMLYMCMEREVHENLSMNGNIHDPFWIKHTILWKMRDSQLYNSQVYSWTSFTFYISFSWARNFFTYYMWWALTFVN